MSSLFSPLPLGGLTLKNRIVIPPMCQYSAVDGKTSGWHTIHYGQLAESGAGLLIIEASAVSPEGRLSLYDIGMWSDECAGALGLTLETIRRHAAPAIFLQLVHAGRKAARKRPWEGNGFLARSEGGWETLAPSALAYSDEDGPEAVPRALNESGDEAGLERVLEDFVSATRRARAIGLDGIEVHSAHGYLLHQFLSPLSNRREDAYGGSLENRLRFPLRVFEKVREAAEGLPVGVRVSATDWVEGGWNLDETLIYSRELEKRGCAYIHVSGGGLSPEQKMSLWPGYQIPFAAEVKKSVKIPVIGVGLINEPEHAEALVAGKEVDLVAVGRGMLYNPRWPWHAAAALKGKVSVPPQYLRSKPRLAGDIFE